MPKYLIVRGEQEYSAPDFTTLRQWAEQGLVRKDDMVWSEGWEGWTSAFDVSGLRDVFQRQAMAPAKEEGQFKFRTRRRRSRGDQKGSAQETQAQSATREPRHKKPRRPSGARPQSSKDARSKGRKREDNKGSQAKSADKGRRPANAASQASAGGVLSLATLFDEDHRYILLRKRRDRRLAYPTRLLMGRVSFDRMCASLAERCVLLSPKQHPFLASWVSSLTEFFGLETAPMVFLDPQPNWRMEAYGPAQRPFFVLGKALVDSSSAPALLFLLARLFGQLHLKSIDPLSAARLLGEPALFSRLQLGAPPRFQAEVFLSWLEENDEACDRIGLCVLQDPACAREALEHLADAAPTPDTSPSLRDYFASPAPLAMQRADALEAFASSPLFSAACSQLATQTQETIRVQLCQFAFSNP